VHEPGKKEGGNLMKSIISVALTVILSMLLVSCGGGGGGGGGGSGVPGSTGTVSVGLTDASTTDYRAVYVTISEVAVHRDGGNWDIVSSPNKTVNLLDLVNGIRQDLGLATLPTGHYTQMRLILDSKPDTSLNILSRAHPYANYFIDNSSTPQEIELKVPSGFQTGIKIVKGFDINANQTTELVLDFDAARSIVKAGASGKWLLKPTIKVLNTLEYSIIQGNAGQPGVLVSAQVYFGDPLTREVACAAGQECVLVSSQVYDGSATVEDKVQVRAATVTDISGNYKLFVEPGSYTLVEYKDDYKTYYRDQKVITTAGLVYDASTNFLVGDASGTLTSNPVDIPGADTEQYATFSIRQAATVDGNPEQIEVKSVNVADGGTLNTTLPVGTYTAVISTFGKTTLVLPFTVTKNTTTNIGPIKF
jgi:hypothetical protein